ncbi:MAG: hypothetical protein JNL12_21680 [Planctomycetes bacterium]|nr:hypothetical protein [Planctomycetota bacterium]
MTEEIPQGWTRTTIDKVLAPLDDGRVLHHGWSPQCLKEPSLTSDAWGVLKTTAIQPGRFLPEHNKQLPDNLKPRPQLEVRAGDILLTCAGPRVRCGVPCLVRETRPRLILSGKMYRFRARPDVMDPRFLEAQLLSQAAQMAIDAMKTGISDSGLNLTHDRFKKLPTTVAPLQEQRQVVAAIDAHFSRLDAATATLERVQRNLERYRASVLKAAVEGRLVPTEAELAKKEGRSYEPASVLLKRILAERRRRWEEAELTKLKAKGKPPTDDRWKAKYEEPAAPDTTDLPELPEGWCWASMDQLGIISGGLTKNAQREKLAKQRPYLRVANVYADELRLDEIKRIGVTEDEAERAELLADDLLVVEGNGSVDQIGRVALWNGSVPGCVHQNHIIKVRFAGATLPKWSLTWMLSTSGRGHIERAASSTSGLHTLSLSKIASLPVPVPPEAEQLRVRSELDRMLSGMANLHGSAAHGRRRVQRLRQSILKWAFEGRLVDQPPGAAPTTALVVNPATMRPSAPTKPSVRR